MRIIVSLIFLVLMPFATADAVQNYYDVDPSRGSYTNDSLLPINYQAYGQYLFFSSINNRFDNGSVRPMYNQTDIWRFDTKTNTAKRVIPDINTFTAENARTYYVLNDKIVYFSHRQMMISNLDGEQKAIVANVKNFDGSLSQDWVVGLNGYAYFVAQSAANPDKAALWRTNGTPAGTSEVSLCHNSDCFFRPIQMTISGGKLFLVATNNASESSLWVIDGNSSTIFTQAKLQPSNDFPLVPYGNGVVFSANKVIWFYDGTSSGTYSIDSFQNRKPNYIRQAVTLGNAMLLAGEDIYLISDHGRGPANIIKTGLLSAPDDFPDFGRPYDFTPTNNGYYFMASRDDSHGGREVRLMKIDTDGNVKEIYNFFALDESDYKINSGKGNKIFVSRFARQRAVGEAAKNELWVSDGTGVGTFKISNNNTMHQYWRFNTSLFLDDHFYFSGYSDASGSELWRSDGTEKGTLQIKELGTGLPRAHKGNMVSSGRHLFHFLERKWIDNTRPTIPNRTDIELWKTDALTMQSSKLTSFDEMQFQANRNLSVVDNGVYFWLSSNDGYEKLNFYAEQTGTTTELASVISGTCRYNQPSKGADLVIGARYFFQAPVPGDAKTCQLWVSDGTKAGTQVISNFPALSGFEVSIGKMVAYNGELYFSVNSVAPEYLGIDTTIYKTNGTIAGTVALHKFAPAADETRIFLAEFIAVDHGIFINVQSTNSTDHLWFWNDVTLNDLGMFETPREFSKFADGIAFLSKNRIYRTNGTVAGTRVVVTLNAAVSEGNLRETPNAKHLIYSAPDNQQQMRLWRTDGTVSGTVAIGNAINWDIFTVNAVVGDDLYISGRYRTDAAVVDTLVRYSLADNTSEQIYQDLDANEYQELSAVAAQDRVFFGGTLKLPSYGGPYVTAHLDDGDLDGDGYRNSDDKFPLHASEHSDLDNDGLGDNVDLDDDNDMMQDRQDLFPINALEWADQDQDGLGDNADSDDDNDGVSDWLDSYPADPTKNTNQVTTPTPKPDTVQPNTGSNEKSGGAMGSLVAALLVLLMGGRRQRLFCL